MMVRARRPAEGGASDGGPEAAAGAVVALPFAGDDAQLVAAARAGHVAAQAALYDRYARVVTRVLARVLGADAELADLRHDVFVQVFSSLHRLRDPVGLGGWIASITVHVARTRLRSRARRWWLRPFADGEEAGAGAGAAAAPGASPEQREAVRETYAILDRLQADERIAFALRVVDGMTLNEVAAACGVSVATAKRRIERARRRFEEHARARPALREWLEGGRRWSGTER